MTESPHIVYDAPPNYERILKAFPAASERGVLFAYGDYVYIPNGGSLPPALAAHESVHLTRQRELFTPDQWWDMYLTDPGFRYNEELLAHVAEYKAQLPGLDRNQRHKLLMATAARLVAPLYHYEPPRSLNRALVDLRQSIETPRKK